MPSRCQTSICLHLTVDAGLLAAVAACAMLATVLIALLVGVFGSYSRPSQGLRSRAGATPKVTRRTRAALVAGQVAVAVTLLAGTGLFLRSLVGAIGLNATIDDSQIVIADMNLAAPPYRYPPERATEAFNEIARRLEGNPAIHSSTSSVFVMGMTPIGHILVDGERRQFSTTVSLLAVDEHTSTPWASGW